MDAALGPPEEMAECEDDLTPMMAQYFELCREYDDSLVLFQVGDFYEAFCDAAERVARLCEITLTKREDSTGTYPMAGIPIDNAESYIDDLLDAGYRVAVADQVEDPDETGGVVERAITRVVTPGTLTEDELLDRAENNYVACLTAESVDGDGRQAVDGDSRQAVDDDSRQALDDDSRQAVDGDSRQALDDDSRQVVDGDERRRYGLAALDVSTGDFYATSTDRRETILDEIGRFDPTEAIVGPDAPADVFDGDCLLSPFDRRAFEFDRAAERVGAYFGDPGRLLADDAEVRACGALLAYAEYTRGGLPPDEQVWADGRDEPTPTEAALDRGDGDGDEIETGTDGERDAIERLAYINHLVRYDPREYMVLDRVAQRSLEVFDHRAVRGHESHTLVEVLDETACSLGRRKLDEWLRRPLLDADRIERRHDAVADLKTAPQLREQLRDRLAEVYDLERLISRIARGRATARDLRSLSDTLAVVPEIESLLNGAESTALADLRDRLDEMADVRELIDDAIKEQPAAELTEGDILKPEYDDDLERLRATERENREWIADLQARERERTGIDSLKVDHNAVHGYYIEVTDPNLDRVPGDYTRRQTLKNAERFVTPELKEREDEILRAQRRADDLEYELFCEVRREIAAESERVQALADRLARLDVFVSFGTVAATNDYARPDVGADEIEIVDGRHPVVERTEDRFVPNDAHFDDDAFFAVITGPNMSGKSTYMRQVALIAVLAQTGSFVPAAAARLPVLDRIFTRVGASDDIAGGRSTFMVEMTELAEILENSTEDSLILLDEVGRGTSTADGLAIAQAVTEYIHDEIGATTLFATHHHELTAVADDLPGVYNLHFETDRVDEKVVFDHEIEPGAARASYGVEVASRAGVPNAVVDRSRNLLDDDARSARNPTVDGAEPAGDPDQPTLGTDDVQAAETDRDRATDHDSTTDHDSATVRQVIERLESVDVATMTPVDALNVLAELKRELDE